MSVHDVVVSEFAVLERSLPETAIIVLVVKAGDGKLSLAHNIEDLEGESDLDRDLRVAKIFRMLADEIETIKPEERTPS